MSRLFAYAIAVVLCLGTTALLANNVRAARYEQTEDSRLASDGAFRDGLYVGSLYAKDGRAAHPPVGRWSADRDRAAFLAGYRLGYGDVVASAKAAAPRAAE